ncbi:MAG TPA: GAF domain-containing SpoIIE family protein phosphatase [Candidatus Krumholzibacteria bacterium]
MSKKGFRIPFGKGDEAAGDDAGHLREENRQLKRAVEELSILNDLARAIGASVDSQEIIRRIVDKSMRAVEAEQTVVTLVDRDAARAVGAMKTLVRAMTSSAEHPRFHLNENLLGWMHLYKKPLLVADPSGDERFQGLSWDPSIRSVLCVPLVVKGELIGVIASYNKKNQTGGFTEDDQRLLAIIAGQSAQIIENARLYEEEKALAAMREQVRLAVRVVDELLPKAPPVIPGYDLAATSVAAQMVGGDYFDFIAYKDGRTSVCLGDVSGKGLPAALLMSNLQATLRGQTALDMAVAETIARSNLLLHRSTDPEKFATLFMGVLEPATGALCYCNAGHERPMLLRRDGGVERLGIGGLALGVLDSFPYEEGTATLDPGDVLVVYSDGIPDATDELGTFFGEERLLEGVRQHAGESAAELVGRIIAAVLAHERGAPRTDDLTVVVVKRLAA